MSCNAQRDIKHLKSVFFLKPSQIKSTSEPNCEMYLSEHLHVTAPGFQTMLNPTHIYTVKKGCENRISHICLFQVLVFLELLDLGLWPLGPWALRPKKLLQKNCSQKKLLQKKIALRKKLLQKKNYMVKNCSKKLFQKKLLL